MSDELARIGEALCRVAGGWVRQDRAGGVKMKVTESAQKDKSIRLHRRDVVDGEVFPRSTYAAWGDLYPALFDHVDGLFTYFIAFFLSAIPAPIHKIVTIASSSTIYVNQSAPPEVLLARAELVFAHLLGSPYVCAEFTHAHVRMK